MQEKYLHHRLQRWRLVSVGWSTGRASLPAGRVFSSCLFTGWGLFFWSLAGRRFCGVAVSSYLLGVAIESDAERGGNRTYWPDVVRRRLALEAVLLAPNSVCFCEGSPISRPNLNSRNRSISSLVLGESDGRLLRLSTELRPADAYLGDAFKG